MKDYYVDMYNFDIFKPEDGNYAIADISVYFSKENYILLREYVKIQTIAANIGGIFEFLMFFLYSNCFKIQ